MQQFTNGQIIVFAANEVLPNQVEYLMNSKCIDFLPLKGVWKGEAENSWAISAMDFEKVRGLTENENCVLLLDERDQNNQHKATLIFTDGSPSQYIGMSMEVPKEEAVKHESYSIGIGFKNGTACSVYTVCKL